MKIVKKILVFLLIVLIIMQFFRPSKNVSAQTSSNDITLLHPIPGDVKSILSKACNDCHTNNTKYPWYAQIQPMAWWLEDHILEGKKELNFSEFALYRLRKQYKKMEEVVEQVEDNLMPLEEYAYVHGDSKLTADEKAKVIGWANGIMTSMKAKYPMDSLIAKKN
jgi:thiamine pyrophosphate-dependent acetolactate synthase large subunit-like protein